MTHRLNRIVRTLIAGAVALALGLAGPLSRPARAATPEEVDKAIARAQAYIWSQMKGNNWEISPVRDRKEGPASVTGWQWGGVSACAVYALLAAGERPVQSPKLAAAMDWLMKAQIYGNYAVGIRCQVYPFLNENELSDNTLPYRQALVRDFQFLLRGIHTDGAKKRGFYPYYVDERGIPLKEHYDLSVSQYGVLGMWACEQAGMEVPNSYWALVDDAWKKAQMNDGGWKYNLAPDQKVKATMTAAGVATLFITQDYLMRLNKWDRCVGGARNDNLDRGLAWMDRHIDELIRGNYYAMYGVERIGVASGRKYFGVHDWYAVGADWLVKHQGKDGAWGEVKENHNPKKIPDTMFAVLFLTRGRAPVVMNKLEYDLDGVAARPAAAGAGAAKPTTAPAASPTPRPSPAPAARGKTVPEPWNQRPRDAANFTHWAMKRSERFLNWQIVNLDVPSKDLHDAPLIYIAGSVPLNFAPEEVQKLKEFVEDGGMILGNSDCGDADFSRSFMALGKRMFPYAGEFRDLPENHSIFTDQQFKAGRWQGKRPLLKGLTNRTRELMVLIPQHDPARWWQNGSYKTREEMYEVMQNIALYASDKAILDPSFSRGATHIVSVNPKVKADKPVKVVRVLLDARANSDPEPGAWRRMATLLHNDHKVKLTVETVKLGDGKLAASGAKLAHLTGTGAFTLTAAQQQEIKDFVAKNGTLIVDAAGGSSDFADAAEQQLAAVFGGRPGSFGVVLDPAHELYRIKAAPIDRFDYRTFARSKMTGRTNAPRIRAIEQAGRLQVLFSREDLVTGMVGMPVDGIMGYEPKTATAIMRNAVLLSAGLGGGVAPVGGPATAPAVAQP